MSTANKPQGLPNPYGSLPNPYALPSAADTAPASSADEQAKPEEKKTTAKLFHNPHLIKRPQAKVANPVKKPIVPRPQMSSSSSDAPVNFQQHSLDYYKSTADDDAAILEETRERRREEARRKKDEKKFRKMFGDWRPTEPYKLRYATRVSAYRASGSFTEKWEDFADFLDSDVHVLPVLPALPVGTVSQANTDHGSRTNDQRSTSKSSSSSPFTSNPMFAPPPLGKRASSSPKRKLSPSPPSGYDPDEPLLRNPGSQSVDGRSAPPPPAPPVVQSSEGSYEPPPAAPLVAQSSESSYEPPPAAAPVAQSAGNAFKLQLELAKKLAAGIPTATKSTPTPPPPPPPPAPPVGQLESTIPPPPAPTPYNPTIAAPPVRYSATISAEPVHYAKAPSPPATRKGEDIDDRPAKKQKTQAPKELSKAEKMMAKMGYVKGQGLGKNADGVTTHLEVKMRKDNNKRQIYNDTGGGDDFDSDKKGKAQQVFDITGGHRKVQKVESSFGEPSRVIVTWGCMDGVDFAEDAQRDDGGIRQEIGDYFRERFGESEKIYFDTNKAPGPVYVHFNDEFTALNAVNRFAEQRVKFQGRPVRAIFYNEAKFVKQIYDH